MENYDDIFSGTTDRRDDGNRKDAWAAKSRRSATAFTL